MKELALTTIMVLLVLATSVFALSMPTVIYGNIQNEGYLKGIEVTLLNTRTDGKATILSDAVGRYQFNPANIEFGFRGGDNFILEAEGFTTDVNDVVSGQIILVDIDLTSADPICPPVDPTVCPDCPDPVICPDPVVCPDPTDCPEPEPIDDNRAIEWLLASLAGAGVAGAAVTLTLGKKAQHYHRGIRNKHSLLTRHRDSDIRHPIGEANPIYKKIDGKYRYVGGDG